MMATTGTGTLVEGGENESLPNLSVISFEGTPSML